MNIHDDGIRERHGLAARTAKGGSTAITVYEGESYVWVDGSYEERGLTPWQARYLAAKLYRLARRVKQRNDATEGEEQ